ncbi:hypothetical protein GCM10011348_28430 [Marinobacterium nitratireducens]|uniref:Cell wall hydrolase SleB domain-containing protein n=1 Tax=Marinobacterium nitratireducens TaxID=518897 RepID=A0A917ZJR8_9GAMM|nr:cell wall hydrolase [Marinobacterium nitratireducens]GGO83797.1 hypothetical protein GCM10011348_28430 [Marinobacterium nitratireducens]
MDLFSVLAACVTLSGSAPDQDAVISEAACEIAADQYQSRLQRLTLTSNDRDAIGRVAFAEAANQGDSGLAGVVYTLVNRLISGRFGGTVTDIVNAPHQFEPVQAVGGWRHLPALAPGQRARVNTIINLALDGRLPDPTHGALFFQNPAVVAKREAAGAVSKGLTHFGGVAPSAVIQDHAFYAAVNDVATLKAQAPVRVTATRREPAKGWDIYGTAQEQALAEALVWDIFASGGAGDAVLMDDSGPH